MKLRGDDFKVDISAKNAIGQGIFAIGQSGV